MQVKRETLNEARELCNFDEPSMWNKTRKNSESFASDVTLGEIFSHLYVALDEFELSCWNISRKGKKKAFIEKTSSRHEPSSIHEA